MGNTTSNQKREIATKGTTHIPQTDGDTDVGKDPMTQATQAFENKVKMPLLMPGTTRTYICHQPIWTSPFQVGPTSFPSKAPFIIGVASGTHIEEAKATSHSTDVFAEGNGVVRTEDTTTQNHANTDGYVDAGLFEGKSPAEIAFLKAHCTIVTLEGTNTVQSVPDGLSVGTGSTSKARHLGYPGPKEDGVPPYYIEILSSSTVEFKSTRKDVTKPQPENPHCWRQGVHTKWLATRTGEKDKLTDQDQGTEEFTVQEFMTKLDWGDHDSWVKTEKPTGYKDKTVHKTSPDNITGNSKAAQAKREQIKKEKVAVKEGTKAKISGAESLEAVFAFFLYHKNPVEVNVQATSCAGSRNSRIRVFPRQKVDVEVSFEDNVKVELQTQRSGAGRRAMAAALKTISKLREAGKIVEKIASLAQQPGVSVKFLEQAKVRFELQYKCCTAEKRGFWGNYYTPAHVGLNWKVSFTCGVLLGFEVKFAVSLINVVAPGIGEPAATGLRRLGYKVDLTFEAKLNVPLTFSIGQDEYDYWSNTGIEIGIKPEFGLYIEAAVGGINLIKFGAKWPGSLTCAFMAADKPNVLCQMQPKGELKTILVLTILKDTWFENSWEHEFTSIRINWKGPKIDIWTRS
jgi:hypothetical protein